jgi:hypothetical protein
VTLIIGIKGADGIVVGSDGAATYTTVLGQSHTITQPTAKLEIIGQHIILGVSGPVGLGQSFRHEIEPPVKTHNNKAPWKNMPEARRFLQEALWKHAQIVWQRAEIISKTAGQHALLEALHTTVVALPVQDEPRLLQFNHQCQPEEASKSLPFVAIGSGQATADPFLAFIRRVFWPDAEPGLKDGIFAVAWALHYSIKAQPGGIAEPIQIVVLEKLASGEWKARKLSEDELGQHRQMIKTLEDEFPKFAKKTFSEPSGEPIPKP